MKKALALLLAIGIITSLAACGTESEVALVQKTEPTPIIKEEPAPEEVLPELDFSDVEDFDDFVDKMEENFEFEETEEEDGRVTVVLKDKDEEIKPALPTVTPQKPEPQPEPTPEVKPEPQPEPTPEVKPEPIPEPIPEPTPEPEPEPAPAPTPAPTPAPEEPKAPEYTYTTNQKHTALKVTDKYLYSTLNDTQKKQYLAIDKAVKGLEPRATIGAASGDVKLYFMYYIYMFDNPEVFYLCNFISYGSQDLYFYYGDGKNYIGQDGVDNRQVKNNILNKKATFDAKVNQIASTIPADAPAVVKERLVYDYILKNSYYNLSAVWNGFNEDNWNAYGILVNGYGVCESYSEAFQTLCQAVGIRCTGVVGTAGGGHKWNAVELEGQWYMCDITFDDPIGSAPDDAYHYYFNRTSEWFSTKPQLG